MVAQTPAAGPEELFDDLARCTHRAALSNGRNGRNERNERIEAVGAGGVRLRVRDNERGGTTTVRIDRVRLIRQCRADAKLS